jgi:hypothetical protein
VFVLQKNRNDSGRYVFVTEYGTQKQRGSIVIPEGHEGWGWRGFSLALNDVMGQSQPATNHPSTSWGISRPNSSLGDRNSKEGKLFFHHLLLSHSRGPLRMERRSPKNQH